MGRFALGLLTLALTCLGAGCGSTPGGDVPAPPGDDPESAVGLYQVTINAAVVLPLKPQVNWPWDGPRKGAVRDAQVLLTRLAQVASFEGLVAAKLAGAATEYAGTAFELPDCYPIVTLDDESFGGTRYIRKDELHPSWDVGLLVRAAPGDRRVLQLVVYDKDLRDDDTVGTWQIAVGDLISQAGAREFVFVDGDGKLAASGLLALQVSVEPLR